MFLEAPSAPLPWGLHFWEGPFPGEVTPPYSVSHPGCLLFLYYVGNDRLTQGLSAPAFQASCRRGLTFGPAPSPLPMRRNRCGRDLCFSTMSVCGLGLMRGEPLSCGRVQSCEEFGVSRETTQVSVAGGCWGGRGVGVGGEIGGVGGPGL